MTPIPMFLTCPKCNARHIDEGDFATKPHHTHSCQACGLTWRPAVEPTVGVQFLPGFKNDAQPAATPTPWLASAIAIVDAYAEEHAKAGSPPVCRTIAAYEIVRRLRAREST